MLRSKTGLTLWAFWLLLGLVYVLPGPGRRLLLRPQPTAVARSPIGPPPGPVMSGSLGALDTDSSESQPRPAEQTKTNAAARARVQEIEDLHRSLEHFAVALRRTAAKQAGAITRVLHYGDSQIDLDHITSQLRAIYQRRYGNGGHGFTPAARPWRWFYQRGIVLDQSDGWRIYRLIGGHRPDGRLGLGGVAAESDAPTAWAQLAMAPGTAASQIELSYLEMPGGGSIDLRIDGKRAALLRTAGPKPKAAFHRVRLALARHQIVVRTRGRVRLFGVVFEREGPGVTWENLPLVGTRFHQMTGLDAADWVEQLARRQADLVVFQFGSNDTISYGKSIAAYRERVEQVLDRLRKGQPKTSCLVIGPLDRLQRDARGRLTTPPTVALIIRQQRAAALGARCAFWDAQQAMGGPGALAVWQRRGLVRKDQVHLNEAGSAALARLLDAALQQRVHEL